MQIEVIEEWSEKIIVDFVLKQKPDNLKPGKGKGYIAAPLATLLNSAVKQIGMQSKLVQSSREAELNQLELKNKSGIGNKALVRSVLPMSKTIKCHSKSGTRY